MDFSAATKVRKKETTTRWFLGDNEVMGLELRQGEKNFEVALSS